MDGSSGNGDGGDIGRNEMKVKMIVRTSVGEFVGNISDTPVSVAELNKVVQSMQENINSASYLYLKSGNKHVVVAGELLKHSVVMFEVVEE